MATVTVAPCRAGGGHLTLSIATDRGTVTRYLSLEDFLRASPDANAAADVVLNNIRVRAIRAGATTAADIKTAVEGVTFQEI